MRARRLSLSRGSAASSATARPYRGCSSGCPSRGAPTHVSSLSRHLLQIGQPPVQQAVAPLVSQTLAEAQLPGCRHRRVMPPPQLQDHGDRQADAQPGGQVVDPAVMAPGRQGHGQGDIQELAPECRAGSVQTDPVSRAPCDLHAATRASQMYASVAMQNTSSVPLKNLARFRDLRFEPLVILVAHEDEIARAQRESPAEVLREPDVVLVAVRAGPGKGPARQTRSGWPRWNRGMRRRRSPARREDASAGRASQADEPGTSPRCTWPWPPIRALAPSAS